jgi:hypothetical protein
MVLTMVLQYASEAGRIFGAGGGGVTVCIAALCNESKDVVVVSDRMITATYPPIAFEHGIPKIERICPSCIVLTAGDALAHADLCRLVRSNISGLSRPRVQQITEEVKKAYVVQRLKTVQERYLSSRGWKLSDFYEEHIRRIPPDLAIAIDNQIATYDYGLQIIVAGADPDEAHIYGIRHPGEVDCYDSIGYHTIGIGAMHAVSNLVANGYLPTANVKMSVYMVYEAKKNAENAPGVGNQTDIMIIRGDSQQIVTPEQIDQLEQIYESRRIRQTEEFQAAVDNLLL